MTLSLWGDSGLAKTPLSPSFPVVNPTFRIVEELPRILRILGTLNPPGPTCNVQDTPAAVSCPETFGPHFEAIKELLAAKNPWPSLKLADFRVVLQDSKSKAYFFIGYTAEDLKKGGITAQPCEGYPGVLLGRSGTNQFDQIQEDAGYFYDFGVSTQLGRGTGLPFFGVTLPQKPSPKPWDKLKSGPKDIAHIVMHELHHMHSHTTLAFRFDDDPQFPEPRGPRYKNEANAITSRFPAACIESKKWMSDLAAEMDEINALNAGWSTLTSEAIRHRLRDMIKRRNAHDSTSLEAKCWNVVRRYERMEGMAEYFASELSKAAGNPRHGISAWNDDISIKNPMTFQEGSEYFYYSGVFVGRALDFLDPSGSWQQRVERGEYPELLLQSLLAK